MKQRKGFISLILVGIMSILVVGVITWYAKNEIDSSQKLGATTYDTQLTDTLNTFRTNVNSSLDNLNTELESVSGTVITNSALLTDLPVAHGGTGTTTVPINMQYLMSSGTTPTWKNLVGGAGITISSTISSTILNTQGFDPTQNFAFTGNNTHAGTETFNGTTTVNGAFSSTASSSFSATTTFSGTVNVPTPTTSTNAVNVSYLTPRLPYLVATTTTFNNSANNSNQVVIATTTFTLPNAGRLAAIFNGYFSNGTNGDGCQAGFNLDGTGSTTVVNFSGISSNAPQIPASFFYIMTATSSAGAHTLNLIGADVSAGICTYAGIFEVEYMGQ